MSNERPDEFLSWRGRLGQPDALPEQGLDNPEATWERLNARLGETRPEEGARLGGTVPDRKATAGKRRRRVYWNGIAAGFLLLALIPATRLYRSRQAGNGTASSPATTANRILTGRTPSVNGTANRATKSPVPAVIPQPANWERVGARFKEKIPVARWQRQATGSVPLSVVTDRQPVESSAPADSGMQLAIHSSPVKKTLRVVSINEIDNPTATGPAITFHRPAVPFRISLNPQASALRMTTAVGEKEFGSVKIKLNP